LFSRLATSVLAFCPQVFLLLYLVSMFVLIWASNQNSKWLGLMTTFQVVVSFNSPLGHASCYLQSPTQI
jgi:hypothetical protein